MISNTYPAEVLDYIKNNVIGTPYKELAKQLNERFGTSYKGDAIKALCNRIGVSNYVNKWSEEEKEYLRNHCDRPYRQLAEEVSKVIGVTRTEINTRNECFNLGLHNERDTRFIDGHHSLTSKPIGTIRKQGRKTYIKVKNDCRTTKANRHGEMGNYRLLHEYLWEQKHGAIPKRAYSYFCRWQ